MLILGDPVAGMLPGGVRGGKVDYSADPGRSCSWRCCLVREEGGLTIVLIVGDPVAGSSIDTSGPVFLSGERLAQ